MAGRPNRSSNTAPAHDERIRRGAPDGPQDGRRGPAGREPVPIGHDDPDAGDRLSGILAVPGAARREVAALESHAGQVAGVRAVATSFAGSHGAPNALEGVRRAATDAQVRALEGDECRIHGRARERRQVRRRRTHGSPVSSNHIARRQPAAGTTCSSGTELELSIEEPRQLAHGESVAQRRRDTARTHVPAAPGVGSSGLASALSSIGPSGCTPLSGFGRSRTTIGMPAPSGAHRVQHRADVRPGPRADVLQIDDEHVEVAQRAVGRRDGRRWCRANGSTSPLRSSIPLASCSRSSVPRMPCSGEKSRTSWTPAARASAERSRSMSDSPCSSTPV